MGRSPSGPAARKRPSPWHLHEPLRRRTALAALILQKRKGAGSTRGPTLPTGDPWESPCENNQRPSGTAGLSRGRPHKAPRWSDGGRLTPRSSRCPWCCRARRLSPGGTEQGGQPANWAQPGPASASPNADLDERRSLSNNFTVKLLGVWGETPVQSCPFREGGTQVGPDAASLSSTQLPSREGQSREQLQAEAPQGPVCRQGNKPAQTGHATGPGATTNSVYQAWPQTIRRDRRVRSRLCWA